MGFDTRAVVIFNLQYFSQIDSLLHLSAQTSGL